MSISVKSLSLAVLAAFFISCTTSKQSTADPNGRHHVNLDTMTVHSGSEGDPLHGLPEYKPARERIWDLLHTSLDLSFDWTKEQVIGKAILTLTPVFYAQQTLELDAVQFEVLSIDIDHKQITNFQNDGYTLLIHLPKRYKKDDQLILEINYIARPQPSEGGASAVITSDQGLFFIDPLDTIPGLARQIWTQGETSNNRKWFPTLDQPNERGTQEITLTVPDTMMTLSNGILVSSTTLPNGLRKDYWKLDLPHAPYLAMIAVGQWDKETDYWRGRPVEYYVDPGYGPSARAIFANTPEMLDFFSRKLGYDFVWPKYSQVIVKDFVSGAMENTTAVVFGDFIQFHKDDVIEDGTNDDIVAHEMFHHWFGDLVTCESWANLTLNEGFANYAEYLWKEYKHGRERADISRLNELSGYFDQVAYDAHPLIHFHYDEEGNMFDAHSYNKGGLVLHMLRDLVGDDAFFASLRSYLQEHEYGAAEADDLRQSFERVTGMDLNWFFDQWYFGKGHPVLEIKHTYDHTARKLNVEFKQTQQDQGFREIFTLPIEIAIYHQDSSVEIQQVLMKDKTQMFSFDLAKAPLAVVIDPRDILLSVVHHDVPESEYALRAISDLSINHRISAMRLMGNIEPEVMRKLMLDTSYTMRAMVISRLVEMEDMERLYEMALREEHPEVQFYILESLMKTDVWKAKEIALRLLDATDRSPVIYTAIHAISKVDVDEAIHQLSHFQHNTSSAVLAVKASVYAKKGNAVGLDFYTSGEAATIHDNYLEEFISAMALFMSGQSSTVQQKGLDIIDSDFYLKTKDPQYRRFYLITGLLKQYSEETNKTYQAKLLDTIKRLYTRETNEYLKGILKEGLGELLD